MQYKLLVSDFDNTLVPFGEPKPRPAVVKAVKKLQAAGVKFALSTGRAYPCVHREQLGGIRPDYIVTCNGACVTDSKGTVVAEHPLTNEEMYALVDFCEDYNYPLQFNFRDACYVYCEYEALRNNYAKMGSNGLTCVDGEDQDRHLIDMPHSAFAAVPPEHVADFMAKYGHLNLNWMQVGAKNADGYGFYDIVRGGMDKGVGLTDLCARLDLPLEETVAAGDSANDLSMLRTAGLGVCMANGTEDAKAAADRVLGLMLSNGLVALASALYCQYQGFADVNAGRGAIVIGLAAVIIGEVLFSRIFRNFAMRLLGVSLGAVVYYLVIQVVLNLGLNTNDLKLISAFVVAIFLAVPYWKGKYFRGAAKSAAKTDAKEAK